MEMSQILTNAREAQTDSEENITNYTLGLIQGLFIGFAVGASVTILSLLTL